MGYAYDSEDCRILAQALDESWKIFLRTGRLTNANADVAKAAFTYALLELAQTGERNTRRLAIAAVARMARFEEKLRSDRSFRRSAERRSA